MTEQRTREVFPLPDGVHTVALGFGDLNGIMRGKRIPASQWETICRNGMAIIGAMFAMDMTCDVWETPYSGFDNGYPDMHVFPQGPPVACPWEEGVALCLGVTEGADHEPVPVDPRNALVRQVERARDMGLVLKAGTELEFYLLDAETRDARQAGNQVYSLLRSAEMEHVLGPLRNGLIEIGIPVEQSNPEYAAGQVEVNLRYDEALVGADRVVRFKNVVKDMAQRQGYIASFMAKPFYDRAGSGFHTHHSLWRDDVNVFADHGRLNDVGRAYLAGLQLRMAEMSIISTPTPNGYRRRQPGMFTPINNAWGYDNRTTGLRILEGSDTAVRIEKRDGAADANPYYLLACELAAGLDGIEQGLVPKFDSEPGNACTNDRYEPLPTTMRHALELARDSSFLEDVMGKEGKQIFIQQAEREETFINQQVTPVEVARYLENL
jgi:glutamine synthetase